jgi:hypothetical protein
MMLRKTPLVVGTILSALAAVSAVDRASAQLDRHYIVEHDWPFLSHPSEPLSRTTNLPSATSRQRIEPPHNPVPQPPTPALTRDMRGMPYIGGRGVRGSGMNDGRGRR